MSDPVTLTLTLSDEDFGRLTDNSMHWRTVDWVAQADRFETTVGRNPYGEINFEHEMAYWVGDSSVAMLMARAYIEARGFEVQVLWDMAEHPNGELLGYVLTTDYVADWWKTLTS